MQIPEQHCRTGLQDRQTDHASDAGLQVILECKNHHRWHRNNAHDPQRAAGLPKWPNHVRSRSVLYLGDLIADQQRTSPQPRSLISAEPYFCPVWLTEVIGQFWTCCHVCCTCLLYTSPSPRDGLLSRMPSSA